MTEKPFIIPLSQFNLKHSGEVTAESPSNIALVKYWGKKEPQLPTNPSISYTLTHSKTISTLSYAPKKDRENHIQVYLDGLEAPDFIPKIKRFFQRIEAYAPYVKELDWVLHTENTFPHSSGIASSASGMSALAKALMLIEKQIGYQADDVKKRASFLSRLGSGSACRSIYPGLVNWGENKFVANSSDLYATPLTNYIHPIFKAFNDTILLIHEGSKTVSSTVGHQLMNNHPYAQVRFQEAYQNIQQLMQILASGDLEAFGELVEHEALSLHAMMMTSTPSFILMKPNTVACIDKIWQFRQEQKLPLYFTLDAGANIHLLYPASEASKINSFIESELLPFCQNRKAIYDAVNFDET